MKLFHTSPSQIHYENGKLIFTRKYPAEFLGLHAWHDLKIAKDRITYGSNKHVYQFDYPIDSIEELEEVTRIDLPIECNAPNFLLNAKAVKLVEDSGAGKGAYHAVVLDYSLITNFKEVIKEVLPQSSK